MKVLNTTPVLPKGTLTAPLSIAIVRVLQEHGPVDLAGIARAVLPATNTQQEKDSAFTGLMRRLRDLCEGLHIHRVLIGDVLHWQAGPGPEEDEEEAMPAVRNIAPPRRVNVMAGHYVPPRNQAMRPGADHRHLHSRGLRC